VAELDCWSIRLCNWRRKGESRAEQHGWGWLDIPLCSHARSSGSPCFSARSPRDVYPATDTDTRLAAARLHSSHRVPSRLISSHLSLRISSRGPCTGSSLSPRSRCSLTMLGSSACGLGMRREIRFVSREGEGGGESVRLGAGLGKVEREWGGGMDGWMSE
jgi:hypothetical protein